MKVKLLTSSEHLRAMEDNAALAALTCRANTNKDYVPQEVLKRIIRLGHESILEHINLTYSVKGLSRACLQELARHRFVSLSVESTRHTLKKLLENPYYLDGLDERPLMDKFGTKLVNQMWKAASEFADFAEDNPEIANDGLKYLLPEFWPTNLILTANIRELRHIMKLRTAPAALNEFRVLAYSMYEAVPDEYKYLLSDCVYKEDSHE